MVTLQCTNSDYSYVTSVIRRKLVNAPFPHSDSDSDVAKYRVLLLSMRLFLSSENDSDTDVAVANFLMGMYPSVSDAKCK